jgi:hypothetical protein
MHREQGPSAWTPPGEEWPLLEKKVHVFAKHPGDRRALEAWKRAVQKVRAGGANVPDIKSRDSAGWTPSVIAVEISSETTETILLPAVVANAPLRGELAA